MKADFTLVTDISIACELLCHNLVFKNVNRQIIDSKPAKNPQLKLSDYDCKQVKLSY